MKKYKARSGAKFGNDEAQIVGETIEKLKDSKGHIKAKTILKDAKNPKSKLHNYFDWEDSEAAKQWRLSQARDLINHVVEVVVINNTNVEQRSFVSVNVINNGKVYVPIQIAIDNEDYRKQLLTKAIKTLENLTITMKLFEEQL